MEIESKLKAAKVFWWKLWYDFDWDTLKKYFETLRALRS
jgi:hypothetical protein